MAQIVRGLSPERVAANLKAVGDEITAACDRVGRDPEDVRIVAAVKYVAEEEIAVLARAGIRIAGENRAQDLAAKAELAPELEWHFIGHIQSRKVRQIIPRVSLLHAVCTESVVRQLGQHAEPGTPVLIEVNVSGEPEKGGVSPDALAEFTDFCREVGNVDVRGLMTMPPLASAPEDSRRWFAALAELAAGHGLRELSMGTTQDFPVAVEEGATMVRIGTRLYR